MSGLEGTESYWGFSIEETHLRSKLSGQKGKIQKDDTQIKKQGL